MYSLNIISNLKLVNLTICQKIYGSSCIQKGSRLSIYRVRISRYPALYVGILDFKWGKSAWKLNKPSVTCNDEERKLFF